MLYSMDECGNGRMQPCNFPVADLQFVQEGRHQRRVRAMIARCGTEHPLAAWDPAITGCHREVGAALVNEDEGSRVIEVKRVPPGGALDRVRFAGARDVFLSVIPSRRIVRDIPATLMVTPRWPTTARNGRPTWRPGAGPPAPAKRPSDRTRSLGAVRLCA